VVVNPVTTAALIQAVISLGVVVFQLALVAGAAWGEYTMGGQNKGRLPRSHSTRDPGQPFAQVRPIGEGQPHVDAGENCETAVQHIRQG
jgi:hypothetical protein